MKKIVISLFLVTWCVAARAAGNGPWVLTQAQWGGVTRASQVVALDPLRQAIQAFDARPGARLVVVHNGGEDGLFWASDLEGWLVALGVPTDRIVDRIGAIQPGRIQLQIEPAPKG